MKCLVKFFEVVVFCFLIGLSIILAVDNRYSQVLLDGINLYIACVLPSLFPYFFITACLSNLNVTSRLCSIFSPISKKLFSVSGAVFYAYFMSIISGYPIGAKIVSELRENNLISETEAVRGSVLCSTSSPMFLIGSVGAIMFNSVLFGLLLYLSNLICSIILGILFSFYKKNEKPFDSKLTANKTQNFLYETAFSSSISVLVVGSIITIFYLLTEVLFNLKLLDGIIAIFNLIFNNKNLAEGLTLGLFECTKGLKKVAMVKIGVLSLPISAFICGLSGISIIMQSVAYLKKAKIKTAVFVFSKLLSAVLNFVVCFVFSLLFF